MSDKNDKYVEITTTFEKKIGDIWFVVDKNTKIAGLKYYNNLTRSKQFFKDLGDKGNYEVTDNKVTKITSMFSCNINRIVYSFNFLKKEELNGD